MRIAGSPNVLGRMLAAVRGRRPADREAEIARVRAELDRTRLELHVAERLRDVGEVRELGEGVRHLLRRMALGEVGERVYVGNDQVVELAEVGRDVFDRNLELVAQASKSRTGGAAC